MLQDQDYALSAYALTCALLNDVRGHRSPFRATRYHAPRRAVVRCGAWEHIYIYIYIYMTLRFNFTTCVVAVFPSLRTREAARCRVEGQTLIPFRGHVIHGGVRGGDPTDDYPPHKMTPQRSQIIRGGVLLGGRLYYNII